MSPVREIMMYANPAHFKSIGVNPARVISFAGGWVNHAMPRELQESYKTIVSSDVLMHQAGGYSPTTGREECKQALVAYEKHVYDVRGLKPANITIGSSSTQLLVDLMRALVDPEDTVALLDPTYCNYPSQILMAADVRIVRFPVVDMATWTYVAAERTEKFVEFIKKEKPKVVLLASPDNPTSQVLPHEFIRATVEALKKIGGVLVIDFAYKDLVFNNSLPEYFSWAPTDTFITIHSNSKWGRGLGRRLGWVEAAEEISGALEAMQSATILSPDTLHQMALERYFHEAITQDTLRPYLRSIATDYAKAAAHTASAIQKYLRRPCFTPQGGLFTCVPVDMDGALFVEQALKKKNVLAVPGWGFGRSLKKAVRLSFGPLVYDAEKIDEGLKRLGAFLKT